MSAPDSDVSSLHTRHTDTVSHTGSHIRTHIHTGTRVRAHRHTYGSTHTDIHTGTHTGTHIHEHTWVHTHTGTYTNTHGYTHGHTHGHIRTGRYGHIHTGTHGLIHIRKHTDTHGHIYTRVHTYGYTRKRTHTYTYGHIRGHTHTYGHTRVHMHTRTHGYTRTDTRAHVRVHTSTRVRGPPQSRKTSLWKGHLRQNSTNVPRVSGDATGTNEKPLRTQVSGGTGGPVGRRDVGTTPSNLRHLVIRPVFRTSLGPLTTQSGSRDRDRRTLKNLRRYRVPHLRHGPTPELSSTPFTRSTLLEHYASSNNFSLPSSVSVISPRCGVENSRVESFEVGNTNTPTASGHRGGQDTPHEVPTRVSSVHL